MEDIRDIIDKIVRGCAKCGIETGDVLAAFVASTVNLDSFNIAVYHNQCLMNDIYSTVRLLRQMSLILHWTEELLLQVQKRSFCKP